MTQPSSWGDGTEVVDVRDGRRYLVQARDITWVDRARAHLVVMNDVTAQRTAEDLQRQHVEAMHRTGRIVALTEATTTRSPPSAKMRWPERTGSVTMMDAAAAGSGAFGAAIAAFAPAAGISLPPCRVISPAPKAAAACSGLPFRMPTPLTNHV